MGVSVPPLPQDLFWAFCSLGDHIYIFGLPLYQLPVETEGCLCLGGTMMNRDLCTDILALLVIRLVLSQQQTADGSCCGHVHVAPQGTQGMEPAPLLVWTLFPTARISVLGYLQDPFCSSGSIEKEKESQGKLKGVWCIWKLSGVLLSRASGPGLLPG